MLGVVLISFIIIGAVTILFFKDQYQQSNSNKLQSAMQIVKQSIQDDLKREHADESSVIFDTVARSQRFKSLITGIANGQKIDLNIYNRKGQLVNTSEDDIYEKGLISRIMRPDAFYQLQDKGKSILIQDEEVAKLSYLSAYLPLLDDQGVTAGYINVPFFSSQKDLRFQISNIVVTLINLYAFIFLISSLLTVLITRWITSSFNVIIRQFGMLNLQQNERINWPYDDEIGLLVSEYNKMVVKVEENAARLAQSERETAWREMARQVAHEIKNPLTPMKLNIQFLQQAMRNDNPNIKELTEKVSGSIIEQIDNLSYIASEFSNFAKMPEARPEIVELGELLNLALKLYVNDAHLQVMVHDSPVLLQVYSDRSQLLRVFTNLLENAKQSIPEDRQGIITVSAGIDNEYALISIGDNGAGIGEDVAEKIFQPYFTTKSSGTGLGLAMTRKIIEFWKGSIWFETREGEGTTFYIKLPLHH
jgi:signal transduction histidine kinase